MLISGFVFKIINALLDTPILYLVIYLFRNRFNLKVAEEIMGFVEEYNKGNIPRAETEEVTPNLIECVKFANDFFGFVKDGKKLSDTDAYIISLALMKGITQDRSVVVYTNDDDITCVLKGVYHLLISKNVGGNDTQAVKELRKAGIYVYGIGDPLNKGRRKIDWHFDTSILHNREELSWMWDIHGKTAKKYGSEISSRVSKALREIDKKYQNKKQK